MAKTPPKIKSSIQERLKEEQQIIKDKQSQIQEDSKDPNKAVLVDINKIGPLKVDGDIMHNRSGMSSKDQQELKNFADSMKIITVGTLYNTGLLQAITIRISKEKVGEFELIAGFRRIEAFKLNNALQIPAIIVDVDDKTARRLRNAENKQRRAVNAYDETYGELEEVQLYSDFDTIKETEKRLRKAANIIKKENELIKKHGAKESDADLILKNNSNYTIEEHVMARELKDIVKEITQKELTTFVNRLEILNLNDTIKELLLKNSISYSEALALKKIAKDDTNLINEAAAYLEEQETIHNKRMSVKEFENYLRDKTNLEKVNRGHKISPISELKNNINKISVDVFSQLSVEKNKEAENIIKEMNESYKLLQNLLKL